MFTSSVNHHSQSTLYTAHTTSSTSPLNTKENNNASFAVKDDFLDEKRDGMERILEMVEEDKDFAQKMVEFYRSTPDRPMFNLEAAMSSPQGLSQLQERTNQFNEEANKVSAQREDIYSMMRAKNYDDVSIFKALMEFNNSLPNEYKQYAGIVRIDTQA